MMVYKENLQLGLVANSGHEDFLTLLENTLNRVWILLYICYSMPPPQKKKKE